MLLCLSLSPLSHSYFIYFSPFHYSLPRLLALPPYLLPTLPVLPQSLNKIIVALLNAIPGVLNAFVIMIIFMSIYAILAVDCKISYASHPLPTHGSPYSSRIRLP